MYYSVELSMLLVDRDEIIRDGRLIKQVLCDTKEVDEKLMEMEQEIAVVTQMMSKTIEDNATHARDQGEYTSNFERLTNRYNQLTQKKKSLEAERNERLYKADVLSGFLFEIGEMDYLDLVFTEERFNAIVENITVHNNGYLTFLFRNGKKVMVEI